MKPITYDKPYLVFAALRGPDQIGIHPETRVAASIILKEQITARIRAIVFHTDEVLGFYNPLPMSQDDFQFTEKTLRVIEKEFYHYVRHLLDAVKHTENHPIWGTHGNELCENLWAALDRFNLGSIEPQVMSSFVFT